MPTSQAMLGRTLGHFQIVELLGKGGFGEVYAARDMVLDRAVALKVLPAEFEGDPERRERFKREARAASALNHPHICTIYELGEFSGGFYIAMELILGTTLRRRILERALTAGEVLQIAVETADAIAEAHDHGIIHRDIKSENILLTPSEHVKVLDFGLATRVAPDWLSTDAEVTGVGPITSPGITLGTLNYMSPEQLFGKTIDPRSDLFSFGVVLYAIVARRLPFQGTSPFETADAILHREPAGLSLASSEPLLRLQRVIWQLLAKRPEARPASARIVLAELQEIAQRAGPSGGRAVEMSSGRALAGRVLLARTPSIAVLPFTNMSADQENEYFSDGLAEELTTTLAAIDGLLVASRTSSFAFKRQNRDIREIAALLNVQTVLEGSVRKIGNRIRINAQLISADDGYQLWSGRYDREMADVFAVQDEIARTIAETLKVRLVALGSGPLVKRYTDDVEAYNLYLKGRYYWNRRHEGVLLKALECFNQALERSPEYALAYSGVADCFNILAFYNYVAPRDGFSRARAAAEKALAIDEQLAEAHASLGLIRTFFDWNFVEGQREFERAIELDPRYGTAHYWYAAHRMALGEADASLESLRRACEAEPLSVNFNGAVALMSYFARRYDEAIEAGRRTLDLEPNFAPVLTFLAWIYTQMGMYEEAIAAWQRAIPLLGELPTSVASLAQTYAFAGRTAEACKLLRELEHVSSRRYVSPYHVAGIHVALSATDEAIAWLERAREERSNWLVFMAVDPVLDPLRGDARFQAIQRAVFSTRDAPSADEALPRS